jgi:hypothetical protein
MNIDHRKRQSLIALPFLIPIPWNRLVTLQAVELDAKSVGSYPDDFAVGSDGDFKVREKEALENYLVYRE